MRGGIVQRFKEGLELGVGESSNETRKTESSTDRRRSRTDFYQHRLTGQHCLCSDSGDRDSPVAPSEELPVQAWHQCRVRELLVELKKARRDVRFDRTFPIRHCDLVSCLGGARGFHHTGRVGSRGVSFSDFGRWCRAVSRCSGFGVRAFRRSGERPTLLFSAALGTFPLFLFLLLFFVAVTAPGFELRST